jgi:RND family efflux transporter MFP subunit
VLFRIDPATYEARVAQARASVAQAESALARLRTEYEDDRARLKTLERTRDLARAEYDRLRKLFEEDEVGTQSGVEQAEQAYNQARDTVDQLRRTLSVYPIRIDEAEATLAAARAQLDERTIDLERTVVRAPFDARIKARSVEAGQFVNVAQQLLTLADDSVLEIPVELYSLDARRWLEFGAQHRNGEGAWFANLAQVPVKIRWTEDKDGHVWEGILHRVEEFNPDTRTLTVRVRVTEEQAMSDEGDMLPLVEGMYCTVEIPGRVVEDVIRLPHWAVSFEDTVYVVDEKNRLATRPVEVVRETEDSTLISAGVAPGELVVTTRLVDPLENTLLDPKVEGLEAATEDPPEALDDTGAPEETV